MKSDFRKFLEFIIFSSGEYETSGPIQNCAIALSQIKGNIGASVSKYRKYRSIGPVIGVYRIPIKFI